MRGCLVVLLTFVCLHSFASAADLATAKFQYESAIASLHGAEIADRHSLGAKYTNVLATLKGQAQGAGDLDGVKFIIGALEEYSRSGDREWTPMDANAGVGKLGADLKKLMDAMGGNLRALEQRTAKEVVRLAGDYDRQLAGLQSGLTKEGKIELAVMVQEERKALAASGEVKAARAVLSGETTPRSGAATIPAEAGTPTAATLQSSAATIPPKGGTPTKVGDLEKRLVGSRWSYPPAEDINEKKAFLTFKADGAAFGGWGSGGFTWKVQGDGSVAITWKGKHEKVMVPDADLKGASLRDAEGKQWVMRRME